MIRIRVKPTHVTLRIGDDPKQRYASAIHALHVIRVAVIERGMAIEDTTKTQQALVACIERARAELDAAIGDVTEPRPVAKERSETFYYKPTSEGFVKVVLSPGEL